MVLTLVVIHGGGHFSGIGDAVKGIYEAGKDFGHTVVDTLDRD